ncbi:MAG: uracil-DNA glycosylase family protein [Pseudomonadota bacterium]
MTEIVAQGNRRGAQQRSRASGEPNAASLARLTEEISACRLCAGSFEHSPRPLFQIAEGAAIAIFSQAPGNRAHQLGRTFLDPSGVRLRDWLGVDEATFYDPRNFIIAPMAFCFPGYDKNGGDKPPPNICAETWRPRLEAAIAPPALTLLVGRYAQVWALGPDARKTLTDTVAAWRSYGPAVLPLPHPSWRNNGWIKKNPWFEEALLPHLKARVKSLLG